MARFTAIFDANILYSVAITDIVMETALAGIFRARWSGDIHDEWIRNLKKNRTDLDSAKIDRRRAVMDKAIPDALITDYKPLIDGLDLPDPKDRHVLAAAISGSADVIVTRNTKDFPEDKVSPFGIEVQHPDTFLIHQRGLNEHLFLQCLRTCRRRLKRKNSPEEYLAGLAAAELVVLAAELEKIKGLL